MNLQEELVKPFTKVLLSGETIAAGETKRLRPDLDVRMWDRLHFHIAGDARPVADLNVRVLFGTPMSGTLCGALLASSTVWYEDTVDLREFSYTYTGIATGYVMSVPVIAPLLYDIIIKNEGNIDRETIYVTVMAQEI